MPSFCLRGEFTVIIKCPNCGFDYEDNDENQCPNCKQKNIHIHAAEVIGTISDEMTVIAETIDFISVSRNEYDYDLKRRIVRINEKDLTSGKERISEKVIDKEIGLKVYKDDPIDEHDTTKREKQVMSLSYRASVMFYNFKNTEDSFKLYQAIKGNIMDKQWEIKPKKLVESIRKYLKNNPPSFKELRLKLDALKSNSSTYPFKIYEADEYVDFENNKIYIFIYEINEIRVIHPEQVKYLERILDSQKNIKK